MPREYQQDGEVAFGGFASYPNPTSLDPQKGILTAVTNMRIVEGVMTPRKGMIKPVDFLENAVAQYAASSSGSNADYIYVWRSDALYRYCTTNPSQPPQVVTAGPRAAGQVRGQGYQTLGTIEAANAANWTRNFFMPFSSEY